MKPCSKKMKYEECELSLLRHAVDLIEKNNKLKEETIKK